MARKKTGNPFPHYVRVREPDKKKLAELVLKAKGENRSISAFARDCGVSTSTLSRLINMETSKANSDDLIAAIAAHADPESGVTLPMLLNAHGLNGVIIPGNHDIKYNLFGPSIKHTSYSNIHYFKDIRQTKEIDGQTAVHMIKIVTEQFFELKDKRNYGTEVEVLTDLKTYLDDFNRLLNMTSNNMKKRKYWKFLVHHNDETLFDILKNLFGELYLEECTECKTSVVTVDAQEFKAIKCLFANRKIKDCVSIILVDLETEEVKDEFQIPMYKEWKRKWMLV